ncbi:MAG TPA: hypothetical protein PLE87_02925 [Phycisphaerae bacterium]|mgnify:FL=1|nr:hypothetical protein [Phycisphaerae bacterium]
MIEPFISPNWHVVILHFPLGLLGMGVILEWISLFWPRSAIRTGGRWMILLGALLAIPAVTLGAYAFREVVAPQTSIDSRWREVVRHSPWSDVQWHYMIRHVWYESIGTAVAVVTAMIWLAGSDNVRRKLYWPGLIVMTAALVLMVVGAWYSGESVYRYGTAVAAAQPHAGPLEVSQPQEDRQHEPDSSATAPADTTVEPSELSAAAEEAPQGDTHEHAGHEHPTWVRRFIPPVQLHLLMVGLTLSFAMAAIGLSIRRWSQDYGPLPASRIPPQSPRVAQPVVQESAEGPAQPIAPAPPVIAPPTMLLPIFPARFWLTSLILAAITAVGGLWMTGDWRLTALLEPVRNRDLDWMNDRLFWHVVFGVTIVLCTLLLAIITRVSRRAKFFTLLFIFLLVIAAVLQLWIGMLMLYDSPHGPVTGFAA